MADTTREKLEEYREDLQLDEAKLTAAVAADQGDVYLLQWLSKAEKALKAIDQASLLPLRPTLESSLLRLLSASTSSASTPGSPSLPNASSDVPKPGRPARHLIARCFILLFQRVESRSLFDVLQALMRTAGDDGKTKSAEKEARAAAFYVAGETFAALGQQVMSLFADLTLLCQRVLKPSSTPVILRYHAVLCLQKVLVAGGRSLNDQAGKDMLKALRQGLADRAGAIVRGCADCLLVLSQQTYLLSTRSEIETVLAACFKALESADFVTKRAISRLAAALLASTQRENSAPPPAGPKKSNKKKKEGEDGSDEDEAPPAAATTAAAAGDGAAARTLLTPVGMLDQLSLPFLKSSSSRKTRTAILDIYASLFSALGTSWVQTHYSTLLKHLIDELPNHARGTTSRPEILSVRTGVGLILRKLIGERMLGEHMQVTAIQEICAGYLKKWPALMPGQNPTSKYSLVMALNECAGLLGQLGSAPPQVQEALTDPLLRCLSHPSHSVQISAAWCLRTLCEVHPAQLTSTIAAVLEMLHKDLTTLTSGGGSSGGDLPRRTNGHARGLAALINVIPQRPLYTSFEVSAKVLSLAIQLLKASGNHELHISAVEIQVAWTLVGALMSLGPNFVRLHLPQLLVLWRNALPKPTTKDTAAGPSTRSDAEWGFLLHVRECTLGALLSFLEHNSPTLVSLETARRIVALLSNTLAFVNGFSVQHPHIAQDQVPGAERSSLTLLDRELMLRCRLFQCFSALAGSPAMEPLQSSLVPVALEAFAEPDRYIGSAAQAAIAASAGNFTSVWALADGYAFGVTSLQRDAESFIAESSGVTYAATSATARSDWLNRDAIEVQLDALQHRPVLGAAEHDPLVLYARNRNPAATTSELPLPPPPATGMVDAALQLFAALLPYQDSTTQVSSLETLLSYCRSSKLEKNPGRRMAIQVNACIGVLGALRMAMQGGPSAGGRRPAGFNNVRLSTAMREIIRDALLHGDLALRAAASEAYGRLAAVAGSQAMSGQVQFLVDQVVSNRDPDGRAGCALAFGSIYSQVGGLAAGPLTKTVVNVLMSLSNDPHPTVHFWALEALRMVIDAASLSYGPFVASTLGMLVKLYMLDTHEPEGGSVGSVNLRGDLPAYQAICRVISAVIGVLGPDLQESARIRSLVLTLLHEFSQEADDGIVVEATKATQHFGLFAPDQLDTAAWIAQLRVQLRSSKRPLKLAAVNGFYQLVQRQALVMSRLGGDRLVEDFFAQLDSDPSIDGVREVILSWLRQTAEISPSGWIDLCQRIMTRSSLSNSADPVAAQDAAQNSSALQDEEVASLDLGGDAGSKGSGAQTSRWRTQLFALQCLHEVFVTVSRSGRLEHFDTSAGVHQRRSLMSSRVADLIKMAFTASTAANSEIRLEGLTVLRDVVENFKATRDPDFSDALLLEQHQAPIAAALTPAFSADSTPEVLAAAVQVCAVFVGSGVVREVERMGRILKLLTASLDNCMESAMDHLGDVRDLSPNASAMLKVAVFTAWAELQVASAKQAYLVKVVKPHIASLSPFWIASLREYARIRTDPESAGLGGGGPGPVVNASLDSQYAGLAREIILPYYNRSWYKMLHAVAVLINQNDPSIAKAMDGEPTTGSETAAAPTNSAFRSEPTLFFFVLYGLAFEALASTASAGSISNEAAQETQTMRIALQAMRSLSKAQYAGSALLQDSIFEELCNLAYRLVMTEPVPVQISVVEMLAGLASSYGTRLLDGDEASRSDTALPSKAKLSHCLRVILCVMGQARTQRGTPDEKTALLRAAYSGFIEIVSLYGLALREELYAVGFYTYSEMLHDESSEVDLVGPTLPSLKTLCEQASKSVRAGSDLLQRAVHGFLSAALQNIDDMRSRAGTVADNKTKNSLLAVTVVLTSLPASLKISQAVVEHCCFLTTQKMSVPETGVALTAIHCARSLILASSRGGPALQYCVGQLLPGLVEFMCTQGSKLGPGLERNDPKMVAVEEVMKAFVGLLNIMPESHRARILGIILPTFILLLDPAAPGSAPRASHALAIGQLVSIATQNSAAFKEATAALDADRRNLLETSIRNALASTINRPAAPVRQEASIALKSFG